MAEGWIKLHRAIRKNWIWEDAQKLKWWLDILLQANHQERKILIGNELILVERGSFHTSIIKLSERWKVDRKTVKRFLELLQNDNMISLKTSKKGTTIKVSNYKDFQAISDDKKDNGEDNKVPTHAPTVGTTEGTTHSPDKSQISPNKRDTNKNDKELYKNEEEGKEGEEGKENSPSLPHLSFPTPYHSKMYEQYGEVPYKTWFMDSDIDYKGNEIVMSVGYELAKDIIETKFKEQLEILLGKKIVVRLKE
ncbi:hypothetical protein [Clostridium sp.]|uniref:hypothetical protein n=1 Tax=Clostridium sp. TaxID=1506 RepID=UPI0034646D6C